MFSVLRTLSLLELVVFSEIVQRGGITAAANHLDMAKSAVSKYLARLEQHLQVKLLVRSSRRISLTTEGKHLLPLVESLIAETERLVEYAHEDSTEPRGQVRIAASHEFGALLSQAFLPQLTRAYPQLSASMKFAYSFDDLQDPSIDLAFRIGHVNDERLVALALGQFHRILVCSPNYPGAAKIETLQDLTAENCLIFSSDKVETQWTFMHRQKELTEQVSVSGNLSAQSFTALAGAAESAAGIAWIPDFVVNEAIKKGTLVQILPEWHSLPAKVFLAYRFGSSRIARIQAVIDLAKHLIPELLSTTSSVESS